MHETRNFAVAARSWLRRPSTLVVLGAGLLAADLLRRYATWTDAISPGFLPVTATVAVAAALLLALSLWGRRRARSRATVAVRLSTTAPPLCDPHLMRPAAAGERLRPRIVVFLFMVLLLLLLPVLLARAAGAS